MKYLLDTCIVSLFVKGQPRVLANLKGQAPANLAISSITEMEIQYGLALNPARTKKLQPVMDAFMDSIHILPYNREDARATAAVRAALRKVGTPIGPYDTLLAGCALARGLVLVTANTAEFERVSGLLLEDWSQ
jgi:tRNA(fMet)-specific endonuclease VapC